MKARFMSLPQNLLSSWQGYWAYQSPFYTATMIDLQTSCFLIRPCLKCRGKNS